MVQVFKGDGPTRVVDEEDVDTIELELRPEDIARLSQALVGEEASAAPAAWADDEVDSPTGSYPIPPFPENPPANPVSSIARPLELSTASSPLQATPAAEVHLVNPVGSTASPLGPATMPPPLPAAAPPEKPAAANLVSPIARPLELVTVSAPLPLLASPPPELTPAVPVAPTSASVEVVTTSASIAAPSPEEQPAASSGEPSEPSTKPVVSVWVPTYAPPEKSSTSPAGSRESATPPSREVIGPLPVKPPATRLFDQGQRTRVSFFGIVAVVAAGLTLWSGVLFRGKDRAASPAPASAVPAIVKTAPIASPPPAEPPPPAPRGEPVRFTNPFDRSEIFEFPPGTSSAEARARVADLLLQRARERQGGPLKPRRALRRHNPATPADETDLARNSSRDR